VAEDDGIVVDVDDARDRGRVLRDLVGVVRTGQAGADVEELPDTRLSRQVADRAAKEAPVGPESGKSQEPGNAK
jgi:hypothetical protein